MTPRMSQPPRCRRCFAQPRANMNPAERNMPNEFGCAKKPTAYGGASLAAAAVSAGSSSSTPCSERRASCGYLTQGLVLVTGPQLGPGGGTAPGGGLKCAPCDL